MEGSQSEECRPAQCLQECIVGPNAEERAVAAEWGKSSAPTTTSSSETNNNKRKRHGDTSTTSCSKNGMTTFQHAVQTFLASGCCVIPNVLPQDFVTTCLAKATADLDLLNRQLEARRKDAPSASSHAIAAAYRVDYREMVDRDGRRRDVRFELDQYPYAAPGLVYNGIVFPLVQHLLTTAAAHQQQQQQQQACKETTTDNAVTLLYMGVMWARKREQTSRKDDTPQKWHGDGGHLFDHVHLPPHCINVFFPLIDVNTEHGPTEVKPGSHRLENSNNNHNNNHHHPDNKSHHEFASFGLQAKAGDAVIFDYRLKHRGALNKSLTQDRPILYLAYSKPWFMDTGNTRSQRSIFTTTTTTNRQPSKPWVSRLLTGQAMPIMSGFEDHTANNNYSFGSNEEETTTAIQNQEGEQHHHHHHHLEDDAGANAGSGERWVLFQMNVQLEEERPEATIVVHQGDIPLEVATQFCLQQELSQDFVPALTATIQQQMREAERTLAEATSGALSTSPVEK